MWREVRMPKRRRLKVFEDVGDVLEGVFLGSLLDDVFGDVFRFEVDDGSEVLVRKYAMLRRLLSDDLVGKRVKIEYEGSGKYGAKTVKYFRVFVFEG